MARTVNVEVHKVRREAFLDVAQNLIQTKGYEQMSIQDVLDKLEASKGAFYHYFDSKQVLLDAVGERFADNAMAAVAPILADPSLPALKKLERVVGGIAQFKAEQKELVLAITEVWNSEGNALVREKVRRMTASRLGPILSMVIRQGVSEGTIVISSSPDETARVLLYLVQGYQEFAGELFLADEKIQARDARRAADLRCVLGKMREVVRLDVARLPALDAEEIRLHHVVVARARAVLRDDFHEGARSRRISAGDVRLEEPQEDLLEVVHGEAAKRDGGRHYRISARSLSIDCSACRT